MMVLSAFDALTWGVSAVMCLDMPGLERKVKRREALADWLEKTRAHQMATGKIVKHRSDLVV